MSVQEPTSQTLREQIERLRHIARSCYNDDVGEHAFEIEQAADRLASLEQFAARTRTSGVLPDVKPVPDAHVERSASDAPQWRPIKSAPDATHVLLFLPNYGVNVGIQTKHPTGDHWWLRDHGEYCYPTHWMPLPGPPLSSASDRNVPASDGAQQRAGHDHEN